MDTKTAKRRANAEECRLRWVETFAKFDAVDAKLISASTRRIARSRSLLERTKNFISKKD
jgi:hypothetical protein